MSIDRLARQYYDHVAMRGTPPPYLEVTKAELKELADFIESIGGVVSKNVTELGRGTFMGIRLKVIDRQPVGTLEGAIAMLHMDCAGLPVDATTDVVVGDVRMLLVEYETQRAALAMAKAKVKQLEVQLKGELDDDDEELEE